MEIPCPYCKNPTHETDFFCPTCGKKLKDSPPSTSIGRQIIIYAIAIFLPPFGLVPAFKYLRQNSPQAKLIGVIAIALTIITVAVTVVLTIQVLSEANKVISSQSLQLQNSGL